MAVVGGIIKLIQKGKITVAAGNTSNTATISAVVTAKSAIIFLGIRISADVTPDNYETEVELTNTTTVTATRTNGTGVDTIVGYCVVEFV